MVQRERAGGGAKAFSSSSQREEIHQHNDCSLHPTHSPVAWLSCSFCSAQSLEFNPGTGMTNTIFHFHGDQSLQQNQDSMPEMPKQPDPLFPPSYKNKISLFGSCQWSGKSQSCFHLGGYFKKEQLMITLENAEDTTELVSEDSMKSRSQRLHQIHSASLA